MKVKDLIAKLSGCDQEADVVLESDLDDTEYPYHDARCEGDAMLFANGDVTRLDDGGEPGEDEVRKKVVILAKE